MPVSRGTARPSFRIRFQHLHDGEQVVPCLEAGPGPGDRFLQVQVISKGVFGFVQEGLEDGGGLIQCVEVKHWNLYIWVLKLWLWGRHGEIRRCRSEFDIAREIRIAELCLLSFFMGPMDIQRCMDCQIKIHLSRKGTPLAGLFHGYTPAWRPVPEIYTDKSGVRLFAGLWRVVKLFKMFKNTNKRIERCRFLGKRPGRRCRRLIGGIIPVKSPVTCAKMNRGG